jgi:hypothetical protein
MALALMASPAQANEEDLENPKLIYCTFVCGNATSNCAQTNSTEYCAGVMTGCMGSCMIF